METSLGAGVRSGRESIVARAVCLALAATVASLCSALVAGVPAPALPVPVPAQAAVLAVLAAELLCLTGAGRHLSAGEAMRNAAIAALLAWSADAGTAIWQAPSTWTDLAQISGFAATVFTLGHFLLLWTNVLRTGRHPSALVQAALAGLPFLFNWLLLLQSPGLLASIPGILPLPSDLRPFPHLIGRAVVLMVFNEALALTVNGIVAGTRLKEPKTHLLLLGSALFASVTPLFADAGSSQAAAGLPWPMNDLAAVAAIVLAQSGLWAEVYLMTGILMDSLKRRRPTAYWGMQSFSAGLVKGAVYGAVFLGLVLAAWRLADSQVVAEAFKSFGLAACVAAGFLVMPLVKTLLESFDGSDPFHTRLARSYRSPLPYVRGAAAGALVCLALDVQLSSLAGHERFLFGALAGALVYAGVDLALDGLSVLGFGRRRRLQTWRVYFALALLGGFVGGAVAWYMDASQTAVVLEKFSKYATLSVAGAGQDVRSYVIYPLFSKWGAMDLGPAAGGVRLLYNESVSGVINWALAAPLFSVNLVFLTALFRRSLDPVRRLLSREGMIGMAEQTVRVLRWGLWMAPIIYTFLRIAPDPSWYNQDGAVRTLLAIAQSASTGPEGFRSWSVQTFMYILAYDWFRILIWFDHMGLRVATLVNLSFVGGDALDEALAKFKGHPGKARCIPEGLRRFATWAPLLIPFFLPMGREWDYVWSASETIQMSGQGAVSPFSVLLPLFLIGAFGSGMAFLAARPTRGGGRGGDPGEEVVSNGVYTVVQSADGRGYSRVYSSARKGQEIDLTLRPSSPAHLAGKFLYLSETGGGGGPQLARLSPDDGPHGPLSVRLSATCCAVDVQADLQLPENETAELLRLRLTNLEDRPRALRLTTFREPVLNDPGMALRHPHYNKLHMATWFDASLSAVFAHNRLLKTGNGRADRRMSGEVYFHAAAVPGNGGELEGFHDDRMRFLGSSTMRSPEGAGAPFEPTDSRELRYRFDPMAGLCLAIKLQAKGTAEVVLLDGYAATATEGARTIKRLLSLPSGLAEPDRPEPAVGPAEHLARERKSLFHPEDGKGFSFSADGSELRTGWNTPRRWAHVMANPLGYGALATNDGCVDSFMGNSQQNGITAFSQESTTTQNPGQAVYFRDMATGEFFTPGFVPCRDEASSHETIFGLGYARFRRGKGPLAVEMTACVLHDRPAELRLIRIVNRGGAPVTLSATVFCQIVLGQVPSDSAGQIEVVEATNAGAMLFRRPGHEFHRGWAYVATSLPVTASETVLARFLGRERDSARPHFVVNGAGDPGQPDDGYRVAALSGIVEVPPGREVRMHVLIGQEPDADAAMSRIAELGRPGAAEEAFERTRSWWRESLSMLALKTDSPAFDRMVNFWLPYQVLTARLWGRLGPHQRSGAYGYRDQLQDVLPMIALRPATAREQILRHCRQQFLEGDVLQWWHETWDGRTGLGMRNRASDPHLWLPYVTAAYVEGTGDVSLLNETVPFLEGQPIPHGSEGIAFVPRVSGDTVTVYRHCLRAVDLTLSRLGRGGLPLIGTGDWNDGLSEVGPGGKGVSVWLGFFLHEVLRRMIPLVRARGEEKRAKRYELASERLRRSLEGSRRGGNYVRAVDDRGRELLYADALCAAWPLLSGAAGREHGRAALLSGLARLERDDMVLLLAPPFDERSDPCPGRIAEYPPGVRENGGQYSHGVSWLVDALAELAGQAAREGDLESAAHWRERGLTLWAKISPLAHAYGSGSSRYGLPPHQQPADVSHGPGYEGRGGWSWYTGAAARMLCAAYALLGLKMVGGKPVIDSALAGMDGMLSLREVKYKEETCARFPGYKGEEKPV
jgi:cyclic beta-1,2-glucan synthetase